MYEFIDKTSTQSGTKINRKALMALQGFETQTTTFDADGNITETNKLGQKKTTVFNGNVITETFVGEKTITKTTTFNKDGSIKETVEEAVS